MATKPSSTFVHATNLNFSIGPALGFVTKLPVPDIPNGFVPGQGVSAEQVNGQFNILGDWLTNWLVLGSSLAGLDAHLVETNGSGETRVATGIFGGTLAAGPGLVVTENAGIQSATIFNSNANGNALEVGATSTIAAAIVTNNGAGPGLTVDSVGGEGVRVTAGSNLTGGVFTGGAGGGTGLTGIGQAAGHGVTGLAGATGCGVLAIGQALSPDAALQVQSNLFPALQARGTLNLQPVLFQPIAPLDGDFWKFPGTVSVERGGLEWQDPAGGSQGASAGKQRAHSTTNGFGFGYSQSLGDTPENGTSTVDKTTMAMGSSAGEFAQPDGDYIVEFSATVRLGAAALLSTRAAVTFIYPGGSVSVQLDFSTLGDRKPASFFIRHTLTNPGGPDIFKIQIASTGGAPGPAAEVIMDNARIVARGSYE